MTRLVLVLGMLAVLSSLGCREAENLRIVGDEGEAATTAPASLSGTGLGFRLSDADEPVDTPLEVRRVVEGEPLGEAEAARLHRRLPKWVQESDNAREFAMPERSLAPPRPGTTIETPFPPKDGPPPAEAVPPGPLRVERFAPEGEVEVAPNVSITFSEPMVPITSLAGLASEAVPARITPEPEGTWSWLGTRTLVFQPRSRLPKATEFTVTVPAGTKASSGNALAEEVRFRFSTPPPALVNSLPWGGSVSLDPVIFAAFDQKIDPEVMFESLRLTADGKSIPVRLVSREEAEKVEEVRRAIERTADGQWMAFRSTRRLPRASEVEVRFVEGARGTEGPLATTNDLVFGFRTAGPLEMVKARCGWFTHCRPRTPFEVEFTNPLDAWRFDPKWVRVEPEIPGLVVDVSGNRVVLRGHTKANTEYKLTIAPGLVDVHGQSLAKPVAAMLSVGPAERRLFRPERSIVVLDPAGPPEFVIHSFNHSRLRIRVYAVTPEDWPSFVAWRRYIGSEPGVLVRDEMLYPEEVPDEVVATRIDLRPALNGEFGHAVVHVWVPKESEEGGYQEQWIAWVQVTKLGLHAFVENDRATAWVTRLEDGTPLDGVEVSFLGSSDSVATQDGLAVIPLGSAADIMVARHGNDTTFVTEDRYYGSTFSRESDGKTLRWFVFDDRGMYQPGEKVHVKGWVRVDDLSRGGDLSLASPGELGERVRYQVFDSRRAELASGSARLSESGSFDFEFEVPKNANLGIAWLHLTLGSLHIHRFSIEEFRKPEYEVRAELGEGPHFAGDDVVATVTASYYAGGGLPDAPVTWTVEQRSTSFTPPNRGDYHFGPAPRWWWPWFDREEERRRETWSARTDAAGTHRLRLSLEKLEPAYPLHLSLTASVEDLNRQRWSGRASMLVHPSDRYVGLRLAKNFVRAGEPIDVDVVVTDVEGTFVGGRPVEVRAARLVTPPRGNRSVEEEVDVQRCQVESRRDPKPVRCRFPTELGGRYQVTAVVTDGQGRRNESALRTWVLGGSAPTERSLEADRVMVIPDEKEYRPGDKATVLVVAPFTPAEGVFTVRRQGVVHLERISLTEPSQTLEVELDDSMVPNVEFAVELVGAAPREGADGEPDPSLPLRPARASGSAKVKVLPSTRTLAVQATPKVARLPPGGSTTLDIEVRDPDGRPVRAAEVAVMVVDEAVLALSNYRTPDPLAAFYRDRPSGVRALGNRENVLLIRSGMEPDEWDLGRRGGGGGLGIGGLGTRGGAGLLAGSKASDADETWGGGLGAGLRQAFAGLGGDEDHPIHAREDFTSLALFAPRLRTDAEGRASVSVKLPDNLTRYRVMAVAAAGDRLFGSTESTITARLPLMVRPSAPRFLNLGDAFELSVLIQNQTDEPVEATVVARATNLELQNGARRVTVLANDRVEVRFPAKTLRAGTARFQFGVAAPGFADASQLELPVYTPATTEAFATYGELDDGAIAQPVRLPDAVFTQFGGLEVTTSSTQLQALTDAVLYLASYPFDCTEQLASRVMSLAALRDVLSAFRAEGLPSPEALEAQMRGDLERLEQMQREDGGWSFWEGQQGTWPYVTVHAAHALVRAMEKGYEPNHRTLARATTYLRRIHEQIPDWYGDDAKRSIEAYALYVLWRNDDVEPEAAVRLIERAGGVEKLPLEALGWIWPILSSSRHELESGDEVLAALRRHVDNRVHETAGSAHFVTSYGDNDWLILHSARRTDGVLLEALIHDQPDSPLIPKLVKGLLGHRTAGRWRNTQENAFVLLALDRYFAVYEGTTPNFVARLWLGERFAGEHAFRGRTTESRELRVPMAWLATNATGTQPLVLAKDGPGRLYYRIGMQYAPRDLSVPPIDRGFAVARTYEGADRPEDVRRDPDGTWRVRLGARVRVRVTMVAPGRRYHVALVDPLPAGFEPLNPALAVTGELPKDPEAAPSPRGPGWWYWLWSRPWYEHQNLRDDRAEAFASILHGGVWEYSYLATATTPGTFVAPPPKAEEMYAPETFGRGAQDRVIVE